MNKYKYILSLIFCMVCIMSLTNIKAEEICKEGLEQENILVSANNNINKNNANLSKLQINQEGLSPNFNKDKTSYCVTVSDKVDELKITAVPEDLNAKVSISGNTGLKNGDNKIDITVTAQNGSKKVYTIIVTKTSDPEKSNSYLLNLIVENATLSPDFSKEEFNYDCGTVGKNIDTLKILAFGENENVKIDIIGNDKLKEGDNKIDIKVTSEDGTTTKVYCITVKRDSDTVTENKIEYINTFIEPEEEKTNIFKKCINSIKNNWLICTMYVLILIEFVQIVYLYKKQKGSYIKNKKNISLDKEFKQKKKEEKRKRNGASKFNDDKN